MSKPRIGLLPLYIALYDKVLPGVRPRMDRFYAEIADALRQRGLEVETVPVCRLRSEFHAAAARFEKAGADAIVTIHLAYSPSLESSGALAKTNLPIIVLDTTPTFSYGPRQVPDELMYNHGIHGVQDMCNVLLRNGVDFEIAAGHWQKSDVLVRIARLARAARLASAMRTARVGIIGRPFKGMGDFAVAPAALKRATGVETIPCRPASLAKLVSAVTEKEVAAEMAVDSAQFTLGRLSADAHRRSARLGIAVRRWIEKERLTAFTANFLDVDRASGLPTVPFLEASKAMARGIGYAGEGDVLTAALVGALASIYPQTSFTEMFCPDWKGGRIFLSHMGEMNPRVAVGKATLAEMDYGFSDTDNPVRVAGRFRSGSAALVDLAPLPGNRYRLIMAPVKMAGITGRDTMDGSVHGWFTPLKMRVDTFLEAYSRWGGTHHAALVYGGAAFELTAFSRWMGWESVVL